ncbi:ROK family protein [Photobacterium sagamiensis]|uniref:ROK family protein n=1 Tax=Photobacterium sagamiensis TaxID=2910241 RepID=UPI003D137F65
MLRLGLDIGGTKIEANVIDENGECVFKHRIPTPTENYDEFILAVTSLVTQVRETVNAEFTIGIGLPGAISPDTDLIKNSNCLILNGNDLRSDLNKALFQPVYIANDADCFTLSEAMDGAGQNGNTVFGVILGTGCGGGLVVNKQLVSGPNAITGEWGHNSLPGYNPFTDGNAGTCYCERSNCIEQFVSGTGFAKRYNDIGLSAPEIIEAAQYGNATAIAHYKHFIDALARSLAAVINVIDPHTIVFGGGMSNVESIYYDLNEAIVPYVFSDTFNTQLRSARHGDASGVRGAAWLPALAENK